jgi:tyrosinase
LSWRCASLDYEELFRIKIVHGKKMQALRWHVRRWFFLLLAAGLAGLPALSLAASVVLASTSTLTLSAAHHTATLEVSAAHDAALRQIAQGRPASLPGDPARYRSAALVLDNLALTAAGARGGYFYKIYLGSAGAAQASAPQLVGTLGPFEIAAARQRGAASLTYALNGVPRDAGTPPSSPLVVTFERADGSDAPLIRIGSVRVALSTEPLN